MNRGSEPTPCQGSASGRSFNEAPIHESGKFGTATGWQPSAARFNEARIHESGKSDVCDEAPTERTALQ